MESDSDDVARDALGPRLELAYATEERQRRIMRLFFNNYFWALPGELRRLRERDDVVLAGTAAAAGHHLDPLSGDRVDVYVSASQSLGVELAHALQSAAGAEATSCCDLFQTTRGHFSPAADSHRWRPSRSLWPRVLIHAQRGSAVR